MSDMNSNRMHADGRPSDDDRALRDTLPDTLPDDAAPVFCAHCGVELESGVERCPLCGNVEEFAQLPPVLNEYAMHEGDEQERVLPMKRIFLSIWSFTMATAIGIVLIVDVATSHAISWSLYPAIGILSGYLIVVLPFIVSHWAWAFAADIGVITLLLLGLDVLYGDGVTWFGAVGFPIVLVVAILTLATGFALRHLRKLSGSALILTAVALLCLAIDVIVRNFIGVGPGVGWSIAVLVSLIPLALLLFFIERTLARVFDFRRRFHL